MERFSSNSVRESLRGSRKRSGYNGNYYDTSASNSASSTPSRKNIKSVRFGDANKNHSPFEASKAGKSSTADHLSPFKIWRKMKDGYYNMMINLGGNGGATFGDKRVPKARKAQASYGASEFDNRVVQEIYKSMSVTS